MIQTLRKKFIVTAMIAVSVLLLVLLGAINAVNALTNLRESQELLTVLVETETGRGPQMLPMERGGRGIWESSPTEDSRMSARFFTVETDCDGKVLHIDLGRIASITEDDAEALYESVSGRTSGHSGNFRFQTVTRDSGGVTVFLDVSQQRGAVLRVAVLSLLAGAVGWGLMLLFVMFLSKKAIEPIAENMARQKRFVTDAGHELKTPLAIILANTEAMELRQGENKYTRNIRDQVQRLSGLTQNLLTLARADESQTVINAEDFSLSELAAESVRPFREPAELKQLSLSSEIEPGIHVHANRQQIGQLLSILLDNAVKYTPEDGHIEVLLKKEGKAVLQVKNTVADTNIPAERLFDRFYRADSARTQKSGGYGIGLSAARAIAEQHKGSLTATYESDKIVFTLRI